MADQLLNITIFILVVGTILFLTIKLGIDRKRKQHKKLSKKQMRDLGEA